MIASFEDESAAIIANRFGKGMVVAFFSDAWTAARDFPDLTRDVIDFALAATAARSRVDIIGANDNMDVAVGNTATGFSVALVNHSSNELEVEVKPTRREANRGGTWVDLSTGNTIQTVSPNRSVKLRINGNGFRVVEFRQSATS